MLPVIALVGRPNVGKSTLFNRLTRSRDAIVDDQPGVTRDRLYGRGQLGKKPYLVVDTGGVTFSEEGFDALIQSQVEQVLEEADELWLLVDSRQGLHAHDEELANRIRKTGKSVRVLVNKAEGMKAELAAADFQALALGEPLPVSALRGDSIESLVNETLQAYDTRDVEAVDHSVPRIALVGRPNAGKSTLTNALLGESRVIVSDVPGTTRDSVSIPLNYKGTDYVITDTAGVRRKSRVDETLEKFSVIKTLQAIEHSNVAVLLLDAKEGISAQDATLAGMIIEMGRALVIVINKWDGLSPRDKKQIDIDLDLKLAFISNIEILTISALHGSAIGGVLPAAKRAYDSTFFEFSTSRLNRTIEAAVKHTAPPSKNGRPIKIKFAHQAGKNPPVVVLHGTQVDRLPDSYLRYIKRFISDKYGLVGAPIRLIQRAVENPFDKDKGKRKRIQGIANPKRRIQARKAEKKLKERRKKQKESKAGREAPR